MSVHIGCGVWLHGMWTGEVIKAIYEPAPEGVVVLPAIASLNALAGVLVYSNEIPPFASTFPVIVNVVHFVLLLHLRSVVFPVVVSTVIDASFNAAIAAALLSPATVAPVLSTVIVKSSLAR